MFSNQTGAESAKVSKRVTKEILKVKDKLVVVIDNYEDTGELVIRGIQTDPITYKRIDKWEFKVRKLAHYLLFFAGGFVIYLMFENRKNAALIAIFFGMLCAAIDEFHQIYSQNRGARISDVAIDTAGVISGVVCSIIVINILKKLFRRREKI